MPRFMQSIQIKLIIIYILLILIAMQLIGVYFIRTLESSFINNFSESLKSQAYLLAEYVEPYLSVHQEGTQNDGRTYADLNDFITNWYSISNAEIEIVDSNGIVLGTSLLAQQSRIGQKNTQTQVNRALQGIREEATLVDGNGVTKRVIANPVSSSGKVIGAVYIVASMEHLYENMHRTNQILISGTLIALGLTALLGIILAHTITKPIKEITRQATAVAEGNFSQQVRIYNRDEIGQLGIVFNHMTNRLREALSSNEEEKEKLSSILTNMSDGVIATDDQGRVIVMNRRAMEMLVVGREQGVGRTIGELLGMSKEQISQHVFGERNTVTTELVTDGEPITLRISFSPIHRRGRGITGTIALLQDVTEQEKLENSRKEFVANVSHELRTPLTTIKSYLEALDDGALDDPALGKRFVGVALNETERMIRLVSDLLQLSRLDSKQAVLAKEPTDVTEMLEEVADRFSFQLQQRRIGIEIEVEGGIQEAVLDRDKIDQVLDNLVSNSIKYSSEGGRISLTAFTSPEGLTIRVRDTGIGIPKKDLDRIFERFYRVDKARSRGMGGTGLGLSIAREIVKAHGGTIELKSELNRGTDVTVTLPSRYAAAEEGEPA